MTDMDLLKQRDGEFNTEEKLLCCVWVHDRAIHGKSYDDIQHDFEVRFRKKAPKHDLLIMWERNAFSTGSVNFNDNFNSISCNSSIKSVNSQGNNSSTEHRHLTVRSGRDSVRSNSHHYSSNGSNRYQSGGHSSSQYTLKQSHSNYHQQHQSMGTTKMNSNLYKTELCRQHYETGKCDYGEKCLFAHGSLDLKQVPNYKTKLCMSYHTTGYCQYGSKCMFIHQKREPESEQSHNHYTSSNHGSNSRIYSHSSNSNHYRPSKMIRQ